MGSKISAAISFLLLLIILLIDSTTFISFLITLSIILSSIGKDNLGLSTLNQGNSG